MSKFLIALLLFASLATPTYSADYEFKEDGPTPLKRLHPDNKPATSFKFTGHAQLSGRFVVAWPAMARGHSNLYVAFLPSPDSAALLPRMHTDRPVPELRLTDPRRAATMLLDPTIMRKLLAKEVLGAEGEATVVVHRYTVSIVCDHRWYEAKLLTVTRRRNVIVGTQDSIPLGCG